LVSAQNRKRLYWTDLPLPSFTDKGLTVKDILETNTDEKYRIKNNIAYFKEKPILSDRLNRIGAVVNTKTQKPSVSISGRVYHINGKSATITAGGGGLGAKTGLYKVSDTVRKLTPVEAERCQTIPDNYTSGLCDNARYRLIGNAWTIDVVAEFLKGLKKN